jgi:hypothetical protein
LRDLDLSIIGPPDSTTYWPWTLDAGDPTAAAVQTQRNSVDNVEQVVISNPESGYYTVGVSHTGTVTLQTYSLLISVTCSTITLGPTTLPATFVERTYNKPITANGGNGAYSFAMTGGSLPQGITLSPTGVLTGAATQAGTFNFTATATDGVGCKGSKGYSLVVRVRPIDPI